MSTVKPGADDEVLSDVHEDVTEPPMYKVIILNDDYTSMEFVIEMLVVVFKKTMAEATAIMLSVHRKGSGVCGVYTHEVAETKVHTVHALARERSFPLKCIMEKE